MSGGILPGRQRFVGTFGSAELGFLVVGLGLFGEALLWGVGGAAGSKKAGEEHQFEGEAMVTS